MSSLQKIKELLMFTKKKTYKINMYAEAILDDARVIATDSEGFDVGAEVYLINDSGEVESLTEGIYTLQDGTKIRIDAESKVAGFGDEEVVDEEVVEEEMQDEEVVAKEEVIEEITADPVVEEIAVKINDATPDEVTEEIAKEVAQVVVDHMAEKVETEVEAVEMSNDVMGELMTRLNSIEEKLEKIDEQPSSDGVNITPTRLRKEKVDLGKMSVNERIKHLMSN
tara:strand:+ start:7162 stop:7836 length:675 start_codon:yes stop_codon:yes gene_type:complete